MFIIILNKNDELKNKLNQNSATRKHSETILEQLINDNNNLIIATADLGASCYTIPKNGKQITKEDYNGNLLACGVRENAMVAIVGGITLHKGLRAIASTFLTFYDYARPAIRIAALMQVPIIMIATHDSIALGEDGPTHQPIENLDSLRIIPNLLVARPCDGFELMWCYEEIVKTNDPSILILSRQTLKTIHKNFITIEDLIISEPIDNAKQKNASTTMMNDLSKNHQSNINQNESINTNFIADNYEQQKNLDRKYNQNQTNNNFELNESLEKDKYLIKNSNSIENQIKNYSNNTKFEIILATGSEVELASKIAINLNKTIASIPIFSISYLHIATWIFLQAYIKFHKTSKNHFSKIQENNCNTEEIEENLSTPNNTDAIQENIGNVNTIKDNLNINAIQENISIVNIEQNEINCSINATQEKTIEINQIENNTNNICNINKYEIFSYLLKQSSQLKDILQKKICEINESEEQIHDIVQNAIKNSKIYIIELSTGLTWNYIFKSADIFNITTFGYSGTHNELTKHFKFCIV